MFLIDVEQVPVNFLFFLLVKVELRGLRLVVRNALDHSLLVLDLVHQ